MLTIQIDDAQLEHRIQEQADATGKTAQAVIEELLITALPTLEYPHLNSIEHGYVIAALSTVSTDHTPDTTLFSQVADAAAYVSNLRKTTWRRS